MEKTLGGDRLGSGKKQKVHLHGYERATFDMSYLWRSTMSAGTLVPFICEVALPGDTFDIELDARILTHPTIGPLFGSYKAQFDIFQAPIRLYQGQLHNNKLGIGMNMSAVKLPLMRLYASNINPNEYQDLDNAQINPSCILAYLGIRGLALPPGTGDPFISRDFNAVPLLAYWDIYKQYYANKQEEKGAVIKTDQPVSAGNVTSVTIKTPAGVTLGTLPAFPLTINLLTSGPLIFDVTYTGGSLDYGTVVINTSNGPINLGSTTFLGDTGTVASFGINFPSMGGIIVNNWNYLNPTNTTPSEPLVELFDLNQIDEMREYILSQTTVNTAVNINTPALAPYKNILPGAIPSTGSRQAILNTQEGLAVKTYQSDLFNNWLSTEWIDGPGGITEVTSIDTSGGSFSIDTLNLSKKVYNMLNRIAVSGGTYDDWLDAVYTHDRFTRAESPIYHGGLSKELVFQEVISNSATSETTSGEQPLGTLAGRGVLSQKHKGGSVTIKIDEPSYIIGIVSLTPRLDYSQGNKWDVDLKTMDDFHKPALDEIGFQELITEQMHWASTSVDPAGVFTKRSAGKQPAWINYMTNVNQVRGNFAIDDPGEMFMTLNRKYEIDTSTGGILDLTTYIDPVKFNNIFAVETLDAQNFWTQISVDMITRRKMSAKVMPNL